MTFPPGQSQVTITIESVDSATYDDLQSLLVTIPTTGTYTGSPDAAQISVTVHPDPNLW